MLNKTPIPTNYKWLITKKQVNQPECLSETLELSITPEIGTFPANSAVEFKMIYSPHNDGATEYDLELRLENIPASALPIGTTIGTKAFSPIQLNVRAFCALPRIKAIPPVICFARSLMCRTSYEAEFFLHNESNVGE